ncbi:MAG TPA: type II secretion system minor pseudopilin GspK [Steroidobacteraceae bacterium]|jgi:general secretion pathway protein K
MKRAAGTTGGRCRPPRSSRAAQRGVALIVAILLVALGTILAAAVAYENAMTARRGTGTFAFDESLLIAQGAEALAAYGIRQFFQSDPNHVYVGQGWDKPVGPMEVVPGVMLEASLEDMQGRLNLNNLVNKDGTPDPVYVAAFTKLLELVGLETKWAPMMVDWIDADIVPQNTDGAEDSVYMGQTPPYRTANRYITSTTELLALPGFGRDRYLALAPYIAALPKDTRVNLCTVKDKVLDAFLPQGQTEFSSTQGQLEKNRTGSPGCFPTLDNYRAAFRDPKAWASVQGKLGQNSTYFRLTSFVTIGGAEFNLYSLLYRDATGAVRPIQRSFTPD